MAFRFASTTPTAVVLGSGMRRSAGMTATSCRRMTTAEVPGRVRRRSIDVRGSAGVPRMRGTAAVGVVMRELGTATVRGAMGSGGATMGSRRAPMVFKPVVHGTAVVRDRAGVWTTHRTTMRAAESMRGHYTMT